MRPLNAAAYGEALSVSCSVGYLTATTVGSAPAADGSAISHALPSAVRPRIFGHDLFPSVWLAVMPTRTSGTSYWVNVAHPGGRTSSRGSLEHRSGNRLVRRGAYHQ